MMIRKMVFGAFALALIALTSGCARFSVPDAGRAPYIHLDESNLVGQRWAIWDEKGRYQIEFEPDGRLWAKADGPYDDFYGHWRVNEQGQLCLKSIYWWKNGTCWDVYGRNGVPEALTPQLKHFSDNYYPIEIVD